ncbi:hypothetical protein T484DRAFT_1778813 [Baffinella frigidus]|nr:hypothetical protein T484DRAFT_1778813 [Cryptophyta sp. CCMP2293]
MGWQIPVSQMCGGPQSHPLLSEGNTPIIGLSGKPATINFSASVQASPDAKAQQPNGATVGAAGGEEVVFGPGGRAVEILVGSVAHLPKMDAMGKCDPYVKLSLGGESRQTRKIKSVYDGTFDERFVMTALEPEEELDDWIGSVNLSLAGLVDTALAVPQVS